MEISEVRKDIPGGLETVRGSLSGLKEYFKFYNFERAHQSLVGKTPAEIYWGREVARKAA
jgi:hypothetical protein